MADIPVSDEQMALRRRARRRLVGAIALALSAIVILPMLFDREPKPLGPDVDVQIPAKDTPFATTIGKDAAPVAPDSAAAPVILPAAPAAPVVAAPAPAESAKAVPGTVAASGPEMKPDSTKPEPDDENKGTEARTYYLQLGVFDKKENADKMVDKAKAAGFKAQVVEDDKHARVRIGPIGDRAKAEQYADHLKAKGIDSQLLSP